MSTREYLLHILTRNITDNKPTHDFCLICTNVDHIMTANLKSTISRLTSVKALLKIAQLPTCI